MSLDTNEKYKLVRGLGLFAAASIIIGNVIGTGVFFKARIMTCNVGTGGWVIAAWVAAGLLALAGALTYAELTSMRPRAGAEYVILRDAYGRISSFLYGWMQIFIAKSGSMAALSVAFTMALNAYLYPNAEATEGLGAIALSTPIVDINYLQLLGILVIVFFTVINAASVTVTGQIATILTCVKIGLVLLVGIGAFLFVADGNFGNFALDSTGAACSDVIESQRYGAAGYSFFAGFAAAMLGALWGYDGWNQLTFVAGEVKDPNRNIPIAIIGSTVLIMVLYALVHISYFYVLDPGSIAAVPDSKPVAQVVAERFSSGDAVNMIAGLAVSIFTFGLMLSALGSLHTSTMAGARIPYAMAQDGVMFKPLRKLSSNGVPLNALIFQGVWASILTLSGSFDTLTNYVVFGSFIFYGLITSAVFLFRRRYPDAERPYKTWGYPIVPVVFLLVTSWLLLQTLYDDTYNSVIGIILILLGLPFYYYFNHVNGPGKGVPNEADLKIDGEIVE